MRLELVERHPLVDRSGVADNVKIIAREIDDPISVFILDVRSANVPLVGNGPVESFSSRWHLMNRERRNDAADIRQSLAHSISGERAADWKEIPRPPVHLCA